MCHHVGTSAVSEVRSAGQDVVAREGSALRQFIIIISNKLRRPRCGGCVDYWKAM
jgi:hypothetical protein